jgi:hypothetical protein
MATLANSCDFRDFDGYRTVTPTTRIRIDFASNATLSNLTRLFRKCGHPDQAAIAACHATP